MSGRITKGGLEGVWMRRVPLPRNAFLVGIAVAAALGAAHGEPLNPPAQPVRKAAKVGMLTGAATGAMVGGPVGAAVGLFVGGIVGDSSGMYAEAASRSGRLQQELADTRLALARATAQADNEAVLAGLAQRLRADVLFKTGSARLQPDLAMALEQVGAILAAHPSLSMQLHGFSDPRGTARYNMRLSQERIAAVREALLRGGAREQQLQAMPHGAELSTAVAGDLDAYAWERRVSLAISSAAPESVASAE